MPANHIERPHRGQFGAWMDDADCGLDFDRRIAISRVQAGVQLVSQPPTPGAEPQPVMKIGCSKK